MYQVKAPVGYYGGKLKMLPHILPLIPEHEIYAEVFFGSGAVFFAKEPSKSEIINDTNGELLNFYSVLRKDTRRLKAKLEATPFSRALFQDASVIYNHPHLFTPLERAWALFLMANQSFSSILDGGWAVAKSNQWPKAFKNKKLRITPSLAERLDLVQLECQDALQVIRTRDSAKSFIYADPPYWNSDCGHYSGYGRHHFLQLLDSLSEVKGKFLLSSYPSEDLDRYVKKNGWQQITVEKPITVTYKTKKYKTECLTFNYEIPQ